GLSPCFRQSSEVGKPASCSLIIPMICASVNRLFLNSSAPSGWADSTSQRGNFRGAGHRHGRFGVNLNSNSKAPDGLHRALLSQVTSRLLGSEDFEIVDVCHHTVVPST